MLYNSTIGLKSKTLPGLNDGLVLIHWSACSEALCPSHLHHNITKACSITWLALYLRFAYLMKVITAFFYYITQGATWQLSAWWRSKTAVILGERGRVPVNHARAGWWITVKVFYIYLYLFLYDSAPIITIFHGFVYIYTVSRLVVG